MTAIVSCPCCNKPISRSAASCISCGHPVKKTLDDRFNIKMALIGIVLLFLLITLIKVTDFDVPGFIKSVVFKQ